MPLRGIESRIAAACLSAGRGPAEVKLIAVSKLQPPDRVKAVLDQGHRIFGENYVQEAAARWPDLRQRFGTVEVHMIGPLQSNKAKPAMELFDAIHTLDRTSLASRLAALAQTEGRCPDLFVQVNIGEEAQKAGVAPADLDAFIAECRARDLSVLGLMCIPPETGDPAPHFRRLAEMAKRNGLAGLSMGMSADFEAAIAEGATHVRVGSAIFGDRPPRG